MAKIDDSVKKKVPELRFKGFTDDWEERKLSEIGKIVTGNTPSTSNKGYYNGDFLFVSPADIQENRYVNKTTTTLTELGFKTGRLVPKGATLFVSIGSTIGKIGQSICDVITNQQINSVISFSDYDDDFIYTSILNSSTKIKQLAATQAVPIINKNEFGKSIIKIPSLEEQQKIGAFFKQLDDTIALHKRKLDLLKEQKKGFLQKMFPKNGAKVPELRFAGFADDWEERKVKDIFKITRGKVLAATEISEEKSDISPFPVYSSQTKNNGLMGYYKDYLFDTAITWTTDGANAGTVSYRSGRFYSTNVNGVLISDKGYTNKAISEILNLEAWKWVSHVGNPKLMNNVMGDISIMIPSSFEEQDRLSDFLNQLDDTIALHQRKLDLLKEQKKGFLQKMFV